LAVKMLAGCISRNSEISKALFVNVAIQIFIG
jgi:hypothetical protein